MFLHEVGLANRSPLIALEHIRDLVLVLLAKELKVRYRSTFLGYFWSVLNPLAFALVLYFAFKVVMQVKIENYLLFLICGLFPWQWFANSLVGSAGYFLGNAGLIKRVFFPRSILVLTSILNEAVHFLASTIVILCFILAAGISPYLSWVWFPLLLVAVQFVLTFGVAMLIATANLFFRDLEKLINIGVTLWFYVTPVLYDAEMIPPPYRWTAYVNPMAGIVICWREMFLHGTLQWAYLGSAAGMSLVALGVGTAVFEWKKGRFAEIV